MLSHKKLTFKNPKLLNNLPLLIILLISLIFRLKPYQYIMGGQDQGTYLNMAHQYTQQKSLNYTDYFRMSLTEYQQELYDDHMNNFMPSIEYINRGNSILAMRMYPMHPICVAIFEILFGQNNAVYALTFFSLLTIIAFYLLGYEISGKKKVVGYLSALLIAINPLHIFFSKFPVGETTALAFTSFGFYFLVKYINDSKVSKEKFRYLIFSLVAFNLFFYTRMSSFMYIPIFYIFAIFVVLYEKSQKAKKELMFYFLVFLGTFFVSYIFYYKFMPSLFYLIYVPTIRKIVGSASEVKIAILSILMMLSLVTINKVKTKKPITKVISFLEKYWVTGLVILMGAILYFSYTRFNEIKLLNIPIEQNIERYWFTGTSQIHKLKYINSYITALYLSPIGFFTFIIGSLIYAIKVKKERNIFIVSLSIFTLYFLLINSVESGIMRYQYYNTRYLLTEVVAYALILIAFFIYKLIQSKKYKWLGITIIVLYSIYSLVFSVIQFKGHEGPSLDLYNQVTSKVTKNDLLLVYKGYDQEKPQKYFDNFATFSLGPLKFYYDLNVFILDTPDRYKDIQLKSMLEKYKNVYLISQKEFSFPELENKQIIRHKYSYYNVPDECTLHTYSFLPLETVSGYNFPDAIKCLTPPYRYYTRYMDFYFYTLNTHKVGNMIK